MLTCAMFLLLRSSCYGSRILWERSKGPIIQVRATHNSSCFVVARLQSLSLSCKCDRRLATLAVTLRWMEPQPVRVRWLYSRLRG